MKVTISGFSGLKSLIEEASKDLDNKNINEQKSTFAYNYPLQFMEIRRRFANNYGLYDKLDRGRSVLSNVEELGQYLCSFGNMHETKLLLSFEELFKHVNICDSKKITMLDYACGQGLGSIVFLNYIENKFNCSLSFLLKMVLIEPSVVALDRAKLLLDRSGELVCVNKNLDELIEDDLKSNSESMKIHVLSNILDMGDKFFCLQRLSNIILKSQSGINYFVCVSPYNQEKLDCFMNYFKSHAGFEEIISFNER